MLQKLGFLPGFNKQVTETGAEGQWFDGDNVRFRYGTPEKIGGWVKRSSYSFLGVCRALHTFVSLAGTTLTGVGTSLKYYIEQGGLYWDITPIRATTAAGDVTFAAVNGSAVLTITDTAHGAVANDFVTFSGAVSLGGVITAGVLNQEYQIVTVVDADTYTISARTAATTIQSLTVDGAIVDTPVPANVSDTGNGGGSTVGTYQVNTGLIIAVAGTGWGSGTWSRGTWGSAATTTSSTELRIWTHDNFGEDLLFNVRDGNIYFWDTDTDTLGTDRGIPLTLLAGADAATPTVAKQVLVSDRDRHVIVFGCDAETSIGTQDPLLIRFSNQESITTWAAAATNTAGDLRVGSGSQIICAVETRQQILVWTDVSVHAMQYLGPPFTFGIDQISENTTIAGPLAVKAVDDMVFWMGVEEFYIYTGQVQKLPCSVRSYVFNDFNVGQQELVTAGLNSSFSEIWWFYPSSEATEVDRYVVFNYEEKVWYYGTMVRTYWLDRGVNDYPVAANTDGYLYNQEYGLNDGTTTPASAIASYIQSSQLSIGEGEEFVFLNRLIPDLTFDASTDSAASVNMTLETRNYPGGQYLQSTASAVTQTATTPVEQFTTEAYIRLRGRSFALKVDSSMTDIQWRLGSPRVEVRPDGRQ